MKFAPTKPMNGTELRARFDHVLQLMNDIERQQRGTTDPAHWKFLEDCWNEYAEELDWLSDEIGV